MERKMGGGFRREETCVCLWLIHVGVWQKPAQYCKAIICQLKKKGEKWLISIWAKPQRICITQNEFVFYRIRQWGGKKGYKGEQHDQACILTSLFRQHWVGRNYRQTN